eukprot:GEMP01069102.1.p1 GENE.GEMP01069102.1~~GEMP01069102.1.p1  ORF type:complete len:141 (+),score=27.24 GEMP01069102.1:295-717(+)
MRLLPKDTTVRHIDLLDYGPKTLLGWHQDSFSIDRHTFTVVTTIVFRGRGGVDYAPIERKDGVAPVLGSIAMCFPGVVGSVQVHGVAVNNAMAHRGRQVSGRRVCFVLFCRSEAVAALLKPTCAPFIVDMRLWWVPAMNE